MLFVPAPTGAARYQLLVERYVEGAPDRHGNITAGYSVAETVPIRAAAPGASEERVISGRNPEDVAWTLYALAGARVEARDRAIWQGDEYEVMGDSLDWTLGPWANPAAGVVIELRRQEG